MLKFLSCFRFLGVILCAAGVAVLRAVTVFGAQDGTLTYILYALLLFGGVLLLWDSYARRDYAPVFGQPKRYHLPLFCYLAAAGFFAEFVMYCHLIYQSIENGVVHLFAAFAPQCIVAFGALLSSFYCGAVGVSYATERYDFRRLRLMHLMPVLWAGGHMLELLSSNDVLQPHTVLKYAVMASALLFFFFLVIEIERGAGALWLTVFFTGAFYGLALLYVIDTVLLLTAGKVTLFSADTELTAALLLIGSFAMALHRNILSNSETEKY